MRLSGTLGSNLGKVTASRAFDFGVRGLDKIRHPAQIHLFQCLAFWDSGIWDPSDMLTMTEIAPVGAADMILSASHTWMRSLY